MTQQATLYRMETAEHICPFGLKSRDLLRREGFALDDRVLSSRQEADTFKREHGVDTISRIEVRVCGWRQPGAARVCFSDGESDYGIGWRLDAWRGLRGYYLNPSRLHSPAGGH